MKKLLTIVIPSYNMEQYLAKCCASILLDSSVEVIIVNDGSRDKTLSIARSIAKTNPHVFKIVDKANGNYGSCVNCGLAIASGRYIKILDADDTFDTCAFASFLRKLSLLKEEIDVILSPFLRVDEDGRAHEPERYDLPEQIVFDRNRFNEKVVYTPMHTVTYRTAMLRQMHYYQTEGISYTDTQWVFLPMSVAKTFVYFNDVVYQYLLGRQGQTVDPRVVNRSFSSYQTLCRDMAKTYVLAQKYKSALNMVALNRNIDRLFRLVYLTEALELPLSRAVTEFKITDMMLQVESEELYVRYWGLTLSSFAKWQVVKFLRLHCRFAKPYLALIRAYDRTTRLLRKI